MKQKVDHKFQIHVLVTRICLKIQFTTFKLEHCKTVVNRFARTSVYRFGVDNIIIDELIRFRLFLYLSASIHIIIVQDVSVHTLATAQSVSGLSVSYLYTSCLRILCKANAQ